MPLVRQLIKVGLILLAASSVAFSSHLFLLISQATLVSGAKTVATDTFAHIYLTVVFSSKGAASSLVVRENANDWYSLK